MLKAARWLGLTTVEEIRTTPVMMLEMVKIIMRCEADAEMFRSRDWLGTFGRG